MSIQVQHTSFDLDATLSKLGYTKDQINEVKTSDILLLPANVDAKESEFVDKSVSLKKTIETKARVTLVVRQGSKHRYYAHGAAEIVGPLLVFLTWQAFDISKGILASWFYEQIKEFVSQKRKPNAKFSWIVIDKEHGKQTRLNYEGPANQLPDILKNFKYEE